MTIPIEWILALNYFFLGLILGLIIFIFLRRIILFPFRAYYAWRCKYYHRKLAEIPDKRTEKILPRSYLSRAAYEYVILEKIDTASAAAQERYIELYEKSGLLEWRGRQLNSRNVWKRRLAADLLGKSLSPKMTTALLLALRDSDPDVRFIAAKGLGKVHAVSALGYLVSLFRDFSEEKCPVIADILIDFGKIAVPAINKALQEKHERSRYWLLRALTEIDIAHEGKKYGYLEKILAELLLDLSPRVRAYSAIALAKLRAKEHLAGIARLLLEDSSSVRTQAARALGILGDSRGIVILSKLLVDQDWEVNYAAAQALLTFGKKRISGELRKGLKHPVHMKRKRCRELLEELELHV